MPDRELAKTGKKCKNGAGTVKELAAWAIVNKYDVWGSVVKELGGPVGDGFLFGKENQDLLSKRGSSINTWYRLSVILPGGGKVANVILVIAKVFALLGAFGV
jgi:hypothetical protein